MRREHQTLEQEDLGHRGVATAVVDKLGLLRDLLEHLAMTASSARLRTTVRVARERFADFEKAWQEVEDEIEQRTD
jgi:hypothetical protein